MDACFTVKTRPKQLVFKLTICAVNVCTQECNIGIVFAYVLFNVLLLNHICILFTDSILYDLSF